MSQLQDELETKDNNPIESNRIRREIEIVIKDIKRDTNDGIGKPEQLKNALSGWLSRRINLEHRLVYKIDKDSIIIAQCRYHY